MDKASIHHEARRLALGYQNEDQRIDVIEAALIQVAEESLKQAHRIEMFDDETVYLHHGLCEGACDYGCGGQHFDAYSLAIDYLIRRLRKGKP